MTNQENKAELLRIIRVAQSAIDDFRDTWRYSGTVASMINDITNSIDCQLDVLNALTIESASKAINQ